MSEILKLNYGAEVNPFETEPLKLSGITFSVTQEAKDAQELAIAEARLITSITTPEEMEACNPALRNVKQCLKDMEAARKAVKDPITKIGKDIEATAKAFCACLESEEERLKGLVAGFLVKQQKESLKEIRRTGEATICVSAGEGIQTVDEWKFEILDEAKAYKESPGLFELVPKKAAIIAAGKAGLKMPHIKVWKETGVRVKA